MEAWDCGLVFSSLATTIKSSPQFPQAWQTGRGRHAPSGLLYEAYWRRWYTIEWRMDRREMILYNKNHLYCSLLFICAVTVGNLMWNTHSYTLYVLTCSYLCTMYNNEGFYLFPDTPILNSIYQTYEVMSDEISKCSKMWPWPAHRFQISPFHSLTYFKSKVTTPTNEAPSTTILNTITATEKHCKHPFLDNPPINNSVTCSNTKWSLFQLLLFYLSMLHFLMQYGDSPRSRLSIEEISFKSPSLQQVLPQHHHQYQCLHSH